MKFFTVLPFIIKQNFLQILSVSFIFLILLAYVSCVVANPGGDYAWWTHLLDPVIGLGTFMVAVLVWYNEKKQDWENKLPKKLTVFFKYKGKNLMSCKEAYLASEGDIRAWAQQIGSQMSGGARLDFKPFIQQDQPKNVHAKDGWYRLYTVTFFLDDIPKPNQNTSNKEEIIAQLNGDGIHWPTEDFE